MVSDTFQKLILKAAKIDCATVHLLAQMRQSSPEMAGPSGLSMPEGFGTRLRLADRLYNDGADFLDDMEDAGEKIKVKTKHKNLKRICRFCNDPYCSGGELYAEITSPHINISIELSGPGNTGS